MPRMVSASKYSRRATAGATARWVIAGFLSAIGAGGVFADDVRYSASRSVLLTYQPAGQAEVNAVDVWVSSDGTRTWGLESTSAAGPNTVRYSAPADGSYAFYLVLRNAAGVSAEPPKSSAAPHVRVVVDTVAPTLQLHRVAVAEQRVELGISLVDENLGPKGVRSFYRSKGDDRWIDIGASTAQDGKLTLALPATVVGIVDLRVVATDLAGNRAADEVRDVRIAPTASPASLPAGEKSTVEIATRRNPVESDADLATSSDIDSSRTAARTGVAEDLRKVSPGNVEPLKRAAARFASQRRYDLAAARLEEALKLSPRDADLLIDLGNALYWTGRYDDADARFDAALVASPENTRAIEGLALVNVTRREYPQARQHLQQLLRLAPDSADAWLRLGDIEHKLGESGRARDAWEHALKLPHADAALRTKAERRLKTFRPENDRADP